MSDGDDDNYAGGKRRLTVNAERTCRLFYFTFPLILLSPLLFFPLQRMINKEITYTKQKDPRSTNLRKVESKYSISAKNKGKA